MAIGNPEQGQRVDALYDRLQGAFMYSGNGDWSIINDVRIDDDEIIFVTQSRNYDSVPRQTREEAYESHEGGTVVVHPDGIDIPGGDAA